MTDEWYREGGPVFVYDVGESDAEKAAQAYLTNSSSFFGELLQDFGGLGICWEHRLVNGICCGSSTNIRE